MIALEGNGVRPGPGRDDPSGRGRVGGSIAGPGVALARTSCHRALERVAAGYIALFQGTPLLMQLFVVYYGLALAGLKLDAWVSVSIGFTLHSGAFLGEIWRGAIEAVPIGQAESAKAAETRSRRIESIVGKLAG